MRGWRDGLDLWLEGICLCSLRVSFSASTLINGSVTIKKGRKILRWLAKLSSKLRNLSPWIEVGLEWPGQAFWALTIYPAWLIWPALPEKGGGCSPRCHSATPPYGKEPRRKRRDRAFSPLPLMLCPGLNHQCSPLLGLWNYVAAAT